MRGKFRQLSRLLDRGGTGPNITHHLVVEIAQESECLRLFVLFSVEFERCFFVLERGP
jgi:hypothetical protein